MKNNKVKEFVKKYRCEIALGTAATGLLVSGTLIGMYIGSLNCHKKLITKLDPFMVDILKMAYHVDGIKGNKIQWAAMMDSDESALKDLGKIGEELIKYSIDNGMKINDESNVIGILAYIKE